MKGYTKEAAKADGMRMWALLRDNPDIDNKQELFRRFPEIAYLDDFICDCTLCEYFPGSCSGCPLLVDKERNIGCITPGQPYYKWRFADARETRAKYAGMVHDQIAAWDTSL